MNKNHCCPLFKVFCESFSSVVSFENKICFLKNNNEKFRINYCFFCGSILSEEIENTEINQKCVCEEMNQVITSSDSAIYFENESGSVIFENNNLKTYFEYCFFCGGELGDFRESEKFPDIQKENYEIVQLKIGNCTTVNSIVEQLGTPDFQKTNVYKSSNKVVIRDVCYVNFVNNADLHIQEFEDNTFEYFLTY